MSGTVVRLPGRTRPDIPAATGTITLDDVAAAQRRKRAMDAVGHLRGYVLILEHRGQAGPLDAYIKAVEDRYTAALAIGGTSLGRQADRAPGSLGSLKQYRRHASVVHDAALILRPPPPAGEPPALTAAPAPVEMWACQDCGTTFDRETSHPCRPPQREPGPATVDASGTAALDWHASAPWEYESPTGAVRLVVPTGDMPTDLDDRLERVFADGEDTPEERSGEETATEPEPGHEPALDEADGQDPKATP